MKYLNLGCGGHFHPDWVNVDFYSTDEKVIAHNLRTRLPFDAQTFDCVYHSHVLEHFSKSDGEYFLRECFRVLKPGCLLRVVVPDLEQIARLYLQALENALSGSSEWSKHYDWIMLEMYDQVVRTFSGGAMADYFRQDPLANEKFVVDRLGKEAELLIQVLRGKAKPNNTITHLDEKEALIRRLLGDEDYHSLTIGRFRQGGEIHQWMYDRYSLKVLLEQIGFESVKVCNHNESGIMGFQEFHLDTLPDGRIRKPDSLFMEAYRAEKSSDDENAVSTFDDPSSLFSLYHDPPKSFEELPEVQQLYQQITELKEQVNELHQKLQRFRKRTKKLKGNLSQLQDIIAESKARPLNKEPKYWQWVKRLWNRQ